MATRNCKTFYEGITGRVYLLALKKSGRIEERQKTLRAKAKRTKNYAFLIEDALARGARTEARDVYECALGDDKIDKAEIEVLKSELAKLDAAEGRYEHEFDLRWSAFAREPTMARYVSLKEVAWAMGRVEAVGTDAIRRLESAGEWRLLSQIALSEYRLADAAKYYLKNSEKPIFVNLFGQDEPPPRRVL